MSALSKYGAVKIETGSPAQVLVMIYDGLLRFLREAAMAIEANQCARAGERCARSLSILEHLLNGLDRAAFPSLCDKLEPLYLFCMQHVVEANAKKDRDGLLEVVKILTPLRDAWAVAERQVAADAARAAAELRKTG